MFVYRPYTGWHLAGWMEKAHVHRFDSLSFQWRSWLPPLCLQPASFATDPYSNPIETRWKPRSGATLGLITSLAPSVVGRLNAWNLNCNGFPAIGLRFRSIHPVSLGGRRVDIWNSNCNGFVCSRSSLFGVYIAKLWHRAVTRSKFEL